MRSSSNLNFFLYSKFSEKTQEIFTPYATIEQPTIRPQNQS